MLYCGGNDTFVQLVDALGFVGELFLRGLKKPHECPAFGRECTPENPLGATMVSSATAIATPT